VRIHIGTRGTAALTAASLVLAAACGSGTSSNGGGVSHAAAAATQSASAPVMTANNASLGTTVLVNRRGLTLYSLSAERNGRFICTDMACLNLWHPVIAPSGGLKGDPVGSLGTVPRPDGGGMQITYRGLPLYTFVNDHKPGSVAGNGFKDVGTWEAATTSKGGGATQPAPTSTSGGGSYGGYGY
jgi:predicted lipoprotein with Yx(FWY)xxD motif